MKTNSYGGLLVVLFVCILAFSFGVVFATAHVGEDFSKEILPTSITRSSDIVQVIDEKSFEPENITVKFQTQTSVKKVNKNSTNTTNSTTKTNSSDNKYNKKNYTRSSSGNSNSRTNYKNGT